VEAHRAAGDVERNRRSFRGVELRVEIGEL